MITKLRYIIVSVCWLFAPAVNANILLQMYDNALQNNQQMNKAIRNFDVSKADIRSRKAKMLPHLYGYASGNATNLTVIDPNGTTTFPLIGNVGVNIPAIAQSSTDLGYTAAVLIREQFLNIESLTKYHISKKTAHMKQLVEADTAQHLILQVATAYFNLLQAKNNVHIINAQSKALQRKVYNANHLRNENEITRDQALQTTEHYNQVNSERMGLNNLLLRSAMNLQKITGVNYPGLKNMRINLAFFRRHHKLKYWKMLALKHNLKLRSLEVQLEIYRTQLSAFSKQLIPEMTAQFVAGINRNYAYQTASIGILLPLYKGGKSLSEKQKVIADYVSTSKQLQEHTNQLQSEIAFQYQMLKNSMQKVTYDRRAMNAARAVLNSTHIKKSNQEKTRADLLDARFNYQKAKYQYINDQYNYVIHLFTLKYLAGVLVPGDLLLNSKTATRK